MSNTYFLNESLLLVDVIWDGLKTINATPIDITHVAIIVCSVITSCSIIQPRITAITGTM
jgi:hypothetical protein